VRLEFGPADAFSRLGLDDLHEAAVEQLSRKATDVEAGRNAATRFVPLGTAVLPKGRMGSLWARRA